MATRMGRLFQRQRQPGDHELHAVCSRRDALVQQSGLVTKSAAQWRVGNDAEADFVADQNRWCLATVQRRLQHRGRARDVLVREHQVRQPQRQTIDQNRPRPRLIERIGELDRRLDRVPPQLTPSLMLGDARAHFVVERLRRRDINPGRAGLGKKLLGMPAFAGTRAAEYESDGGWFRDDRVSCERLIDDYINLTKDSPLAIFPRHYPASVPSEVGASIDFSGPLSLCTSKRNPCRRRAAQLIRMWHPRKASTSVDIARLYLRGTEGQRTRESSPATPEMVAKQQRWRAEIR